MSLISGLNKLSEELNSADQLCVASKPKSKSFSNILKDLYDSSVQLSSAKVGPFDSLIVQGLDIESIWEEIDTRNKPLTRVLSGKISKLTASINSNVDTSVIKKTHNNKRSKALASEWQEDIEETDDTTDHSDEATSENNDDSENDEASDDAVEDLLNGEIEGDNDAAGDEDMDAWLDKAERQEEHHYLKMQRKDKNEGHKGVSENQSDDEDEEDDDMAFVQARMYEDEDDSEDDQAATLCRYKDFFVGGVTVQKEKATNVDVLAASRHSKKPRQKKVDHSSEDDMLGSGSDADDVEGEGSSDYDREDAEDDDEDENDEDEDEGFGSGGDLPDDYVDSEDEEEEEEESHGRMTENSSKPLTKFQHKSAALSSEIAELEAQLVQRRSWELRGEVKGADRPENSLLGISADIERSSKPAPLVTHEFTSSLEDTIRRRIKEDKFDDVAAFSSDDRRSARPSDGGPELSQERSRVGLGEVYAEHFLAKSLNSQPEAVSRKLEGAREEVLSLYNKVSMQLDELSHFFFAPRPVVADTKLQSLGAAPSSGSGGGLSSLEMEDIVPLVNSAASQLAPEQVQQKRRGRDSSLLSAEELTSDDKKRLRRARKETARRADKHGSDSDSEDGADTKAGRKRKLGKADRALDLELARDKRVTLSGGNGSDSADKGRNNEDNTAYSKSAAFFTKLQHSAQAEISGKGRETAAGLSKKSSNALGSGNGRSYKL